MIQYLLLGLLALALTLIGARVFIAADPHRLAVWTRRIGGVLALAGAGGLILARVYLLAVPLAFIGYLLLSRRAPLGGGSSPAGRAAGRASSVRTAFLEMMLDHDSGEMRGTVLAGAFAGRDLAGLGKDELLVLFNECRAAEAESRQLLEAYLDRRWPGWREELRRREQAGAAGGRRGPMSLEEAREVLGVAAGARAEEIRAAHRSLMKRLHPDQGGSTYLAAKINEARDVLLRAAGE